MYTRYCLCLVSFIACFYLHGSSQNLVRNASFEAYSELPEYLSQWQRCDHWNEMISIRDSSTPDYYHERSLSVNNFERTIVYPNTGEAYVGFQGHSVLMIGLYNKHSREYISTKLRNTMRIGKKYLISFYITNGEVIHTLGKSCNGMGLLLSTEPVQQFHQLAIFRDTPIIVDEQVWSTTWKKYEFEFVADSAYEYLTIGNFLHDSLVVLVDNIPGESRANYYFFDDIDVSPGWFYISGDTTICKGDMAKLHAVNGSNVKWLNEDMSSISVNVSSDSIEVSPEDTNIYYAVSGSDTAEFIVNVNHLSNYKTYTDTVLCKGNGIKIENNQADSIFLDEFSASARNEITHSGDYDIILYYKGCESQQSIKAEFVNCDCPVFIPNSITPNNDGINEGFLPIFNCLTQKYSLEIFNRWGFPVFQTNDVNESWLGNNIVDGMYYYKLKYTINLSDEHEVIGKILVL